MTNKNTNHDCVGKKIINNFIDSRAQQEKEKSESILQTLTKWYEKFNEDLCCVEYPVKLKYFNLSKFKFDYNIIYKKPIATMIEDRILRIDLPGVSVADWNKFVSTFGLRVTPSHVFDFHLDANRKVYFLFPISPNGYWWNILAGKGYSYELVLENLCQELSLYISNFNNNYGKKYGNL